MYLLQCPECPEGHEIRVSASAAGSQVTCPACGKPIDVPKLGELRQLPRAEEETHSSRSGGASFAQRMIFAVLMLGALGAGCSAAFGAFRWQMLPVPPTSEIHIENDRAEIAKLNPREILEVWKQYRKVSLAEREPYDYQRMQGLRDHWKNVCLTSAMIAAGCVVVATLVVLLRRSQAKAGHLV